MSRAKQFVDQFTSAMDVIQKNVDNDLCFSVMIYARDPKDKNDKFPDGDIRMSIVNQTTMYDDRTIKEWITT